MVHLKIFLVRHFKISFEKQNHTSLIDIVSSFAKLFLGAMDPIVILYCTGILSNLLANNQMNKEFLFSRGAIPTLYRVLISSYSIPASTPNQQQRVEDIQVVLGKVFWIINLFFLPIIF